MFMSMFCRHDMKVVSEIKTDSSMKTMVDLARRSPDPATLEDMLSMTKHYHIITLSCSKCGKTKQYKNKAH